MISRTFLPSARKAFGDGGGAQRAADAQHRRMIGGHRDHDRARARRAGDLGFEEVGDFAAALADQPDRRSHRPAAARTIMPSSTDLPTPEPAMMPTRWPWPIGQQPVDRAHADIQRLAHAAAIERRSAACPRAASAPRRGSGRARRSACPRHRRRGRAAPRRLPPRPAAPIGRTGALRQQRRGAAEIHQQRAAVAKADHFGLDARCRRRRRPRRPCRPAAISPTASISSPSNEASRPETLGLGAKSAQPSVSR